jgi:hypothetical protein
MPIQFVAEREFIVGQEAVVEGRAPKGHFVAVFEDDGLTGYFYALDTSADGQQIQDAVQVYNVESVTDRARPSVAKLGWSADSKKVILLINGQPHAVFDFESKQGYCRTGFPPANSGGGWSVNGHVWSEAAIELFA